MLEPRFFDELARRVSGLVAATPAKDVEKNLRALLTAALGRLDLVTREEFDLQREALSRARNRLAELEARIAESDKGRK
jgi:ubiquinone biosynthesis accessory factor UbiK